MASPKSFYNLQAQFLNLGLPGQAVSFEEFRNKPLIITNSACKCGLSATNFDQLKQLHQQFGSTIGLKILLFPSNSFNQELASAEDVADFLRDRYKSEDISGTFYIAQRTSVLGTNIHPVFEYLKSQAKGFMFNSIKWNFTKFLVDTNGEVVKRLGPNEEPKTLIPHLEKMAKDFEK